MRRQWSQAGQWAARWSRHYRRPVYFAELGCDSRLEPTSRANYYAAWRAALREADLGWAVADWTQQHRYWDAKAQQPLPGLRQALFPEQAGQSPSADHQELLHNALRQLADLKSQVQTTERVSTEELDKLRVRASEAQTQAQQTHDLARWLMGGLLGLTLLVLASFFLRRRPLAPAARSRGDRELQLGSDPRTKGTPPQLTELLLEKVAQRLLSDRQQNRMLQLCATEELKALEQRLAELHAPIEMRLNAYEQRIQELEEELRQKGEENRELLETKIELTKQRLAVARGGGSEDWN